MPVLLVALPISACSGYSLGAGILATRRCRCRDITLRLTGGSPTTCDAIVVPPAWTAEVLLYGVLLLQRKIRRTGTIER